MAEVVSLDNGVRIVCDPMPGLETAAIGIWYRAGALDENNEERGVAHLLEHMAFKGTTRRSARAIAEEIENVGGYLNASTGYGRTGYYARILKPDVDTAFGILADILLDPLFLDDELEKEKDVVVQEIGEAADTPDDAVMEMLQRVCYGEHALGRPILGTEDSVMSHTPERLRAFMQKNYTPQDMIIVAAGGFDAAVIKSLATNAFSGARRTQRVFRPEKPAYIGGRVHEARDIEQTHIAVNFPGVSATEPSFFATRVFTEALGGGMSSRIFQAIREQRGLAYSVYAFTDSYDDVGGVCAYVGTDSDQAAEAVGLIKSEITAMAGDVTRQEIDRARALLKSNLLMGLESPAARAEAAASQLFSYGRLFTTAEMCERLDAVTADDIRACAEHALSAGDPSLAIVGPADFDAVSARLL
ncbi:MAG: pitrilysin family protein [Parvularculaceae bacterium]